MDIYTKILRWAFSQTFGSKAKAAFDTEIAPEITALTTGHTDPTALAASIISGPQFTAWLTKLTTTAKVPALFQGIVESVLQGYIETLVADLIKKATKVSK